VGGFPLVPIAEDLYLVRRLARMGRIALAPGTAVTSGRRWRRVGIGRTTLINALICRRLGIDAGRRSVCDWRVDIVLPGEEGCRAHGRNDRQSPLITAVVANGRGEISTWPVMPRWAATAAAMHR
jgi:hypothetical protein